MENMSEEGEEIYEVIKCATAEKDGNSLYLSIEGIMESFGSTEEEGKFNAPIPETYTISYYYSSPPLLSQESNPDPNRSTVSENDGSESKNDGATETAQWDEGYKHPYYAVGGIEEFTTLKSLH